MSEPEDRNVAMLRDAYRQWSESLGGSVDEWMKICAEDIAFGSLSEGRRARNTWAPITPAIRSKNTSAA